MADDFAILCAWCLLFRHIYMFMVPRYHGNKSTNEILVIHENSYIFKIFIDI